MAPKPIRELRDLTRYRKAQVEERTREVQRPGQGPPGRRRPSCPAWPATSWAAPGRDVLQALVAGTRDPAVLAELARGKLRQKLPALRQALQGRFGAHHALLVGQILAKLDFLDGAIAQLSAEIDRVIAPFQPQVALLDTIPGWTCAPRRR